MAGPAFPSWAYNATSPAQIVQTQAAFNALGPGWTFTPFASTVLNVPTDVGLVDTDIRLQQLLIEARVANLLLQAGFGLIDNVDTQGLRADVLSQDSSLTS